MKKKNKTNRKKEHQSLPLKVLRKKYNKEKITFFSWYPFSLFSKNIYSVYLKILTHMRESITDSFKYFLKLNMCLEWYKLTPTNQCLN